MSRRGKVYITLDKIDGSRDVVKGPIYPDEIDTFGLLMYLNQADVAGVSFVRADLLNRIGKIDGDKAETEQASDQAAKPPV